jgi:hypothetical protein
MTSGLGANQGDQLRVLPDHLGAGLQPRRLRLADALLVMLRFADVRPRPGTRSGTLGSAGGARSFRF